MIILHSMLLGTATVSESTQWFAQQSPQAIHQPQPSPHQQPMTELQHQVVAYPQVQMSPQTVVTASLTSTTYTDLLQPQQQQVEILQERIQEVQEGIAPVGPPQQFQGKFTQRLKFYQLEWSYPLVSVLLDTLITTPSHSVVKFDCNEKKHVNQTQQ